MILISDGHRSKEIFGWKEKKGWKNMETSFVIFLPNKFSILSFFYNKTGSADVRRWFWQMKETRIKKILTKKE
jgi:hypothetical protein